MSFDMKIKVFLFLGFSQSIRQNKWSDLVEEVMANQIYDITVQA